MPLPSVSASDPAADGSRWALMRTALPDEWLQWYWLTFAVLAEISAAASALVIFVVLTRPELRSQTFNKFLVGLAVPDFVFSFLCGWTCLAHLVHRAWFGGAPMCSIQSVYVVYGLTASLWAKATSAAELHRLASCAVRAKVYRPLSARVTAARLVSVHIGALLFSCMQLVPGMPIEAGAHRGLFCFPIEYDLASTIFQWAFTVNLGLVVPALAVLWHFCRARVWTNLTVRAPS